MEKNQRYIFAGLAALVIVLAALILLLNKKTPAQKTPYNGSSIKPLPTSSHTLPKQEVTVSVTKDGFSPSYLTISPQTKVTWINQSGEQVTVNSNDHPTHKKFPELNLGVFDNGSSVQFVFEKKGTFTYHDHYHPTHKGTILVQ